jgi:hypothetical protein
MSNTNYIQETETIQSFSQKNLWQIKPYVYKITNLLNNCFYIGKHKPKNQNEDFYDYMGSGTIISYAIEKYGIQNFKKEIISYFNTCDEAYAYEELIVNEDMIKNPNCYNVCLGGLKPPSCLGKKWINKNNKQKVVKFDELENYFIEGWDLGLSLQTRKKISQKHIGKKHSLKSKQKMSKSRIGKKLSVQTRKKISQSNIGKHNHQNKNNPMFGRKHSLKSKQQMSESKKGKSNPITAIRNKTNQNPNNIKVKCPYDDKITSLPNIGKWIKNHHSDKKQWNEFTKEEQKLYWVISHNYDIN